MLTIGEKHLRKRYVYPNNIIDIYSGSTHIWPYITNTIISPWNILLSASPTTISDAGGAVTLSHSTSRIITDVWVDYTGNTASCRETYTTESATASLSTTLGSISGNTLTIPANSEYNDKTITVTASYGGANKSITITQEANKVPTITGYGSWILNIYSYTTNFSKSGGDAYIIVDCYRTINWSDGSYTYELYEGDVSLSTNIGTLSYTEVTGNVGSTTLTVGANTSTSSRTITVSGSVNVYGTYLSDSISFTQDVGDTYVMLKTSTDSSTSITFPGGTMNIAGYGYICCYSTKNGNKQSVSTSSNVSWLTVTEDNSLPYSGANYNFRFDQTENTSTSSRTGVITITQAESDNTVKWSITQAGKEAAPTITSRGEWSVSVSADPTELTSNGGTSTITATCKRTIYWSDNTTTTEYSSNLISLSTNLGTLSSTSVSSNLGISTLTISANTDTSDKTATITATCQSKSDTCSVIVEGAEPSYSYNANLVINDNLAIGWKIFYNEDSYKVGDIIDWVGIHYGNISITVNTDLLPLLICRINIGDSPSPPIDWVYTLTEFDEGDTITVNVS